MKSVLETQIPKTDLISTDLRKEWTNIPSLKTYNVSVLGKETNIQAILYNDKFVNFMSKWYHVLPNEEVIETADLIADQLEFKKFVPTKYHKDSWFTSDKGHVIGNPDKTQITATYTFGNKVDVTGRGDFVEYGVAVRNSIDGKGGAFSVSPFTIRQACDNLAFHLAFDQTLHSGLKEAKIGQGYYKSLVKLQESEVLKKQLGDIQEARKTWQETKFKKSHFAGLDLKYVTNAVLTVKEQAESILQKYKEMVSLKITQAQIESLKNKLPVTVTKYADTQVKDSVISYNSKKKELKVDKDATVWQVFNNYTEALSYGQKRNYTTTLETYKILDQILVAPVQVKG